MRIIGERLPARADEIESDLASRGLIGPSLRVEAIAKAALKIRGKRPFRVSGKGPARLVLEPQQRAIVEKARALIRRYASPFPVRAGDIRLRLARFLGESPLAKVVDAMLISSRGFHWLEELTGWFWLEVDPISRVRRRIRQILSVTPRLPIAELPTALRRDLRLPKRLPPLEILTEFCRQLPECRVQGGDLVAVARADPLTSFDGRELKMVRLLLRRGPIQSAARLEEMAEQAGMTKAAFWHGVRHCPAIRDYPPDRIGLIGAELAEKKPARRAGQQPARVRSAPADKPPMAPKHRAPVPRHRPRVAAKQTKRKQ
jgi:hypothetical protein